MSEMPTKLLMGGDEVAVPDDPQQWMDLHRWMEHELESLSARRFYYEHDLDNGTIQFFDDENQTWRFQAPIDRWERMATRRSNRKDRVERACRHAQESRLRSRTLAIEGKPRLNRAIYC